MPYCHRCGFDLETAANFCPECGAAQRGDEPPRSELRSAGASLAGRTWVNALLGGTIGLILGLIVASAFAIFYVVGILVGGIVAGYLQGRGISAGAKVGALAGLFSTAPVILLIFILTILGIGSVLLGFARHLLPAEPGLIGPGVMLVFLGLFLVFATLTNLLCGAFGGVVGGALVEDGGRDR